MITPANYTFMDISTAVHAVIDHCWGEGVITVEGRGVIRLLLTSILSYCRCVNMQIEDPDFVALQTLC